MTNSTEQSGDSASLRPLATPTANESVVMMLPLVCHRDNLAVPYIDSEQYKMVMLSQCTVSRFGIRPPPQRLYV